MTIKCCANCTHWQMNRGGNQPQLQLEAYEKPSSFQSIYGICSLPSDEVISPMLIVIADPTFGDPVPELHTQNNFSCAAHQATG